MAPGPLRRLLAVSEERHFVGAAWRRHIDLSPIRTHTATSKWRITIIHTVDYNGLCAVSLAAKTATRVISSASVT